MAIMIPQKPREISPNSLEDIMFGALEKLPDTYYVFHSFKIVSAGDGVLHESETDFVIFNAQKGPAGFPAGPKLRLQGITAPLPDGR